MLILVATPIGNARDLSERAKASLSDADLVLCEDTRVTGALLGSLGIDKPLLSYHDHNEASRAERVLAMLAEGKTLCLVSDAGMPGISDPGQRLVRVAAAAGCRITVVPGPSAVISALAVSGLDTRRFMFEGFLAAKGAERAARLAALAAADWTVVLYEAPHRLRKTLADLAAAGLGDRKLTVVRELTKRYEEVLYLDVDEAVRHFVTVPPRGEFVLVLEGLAAVRERLPDYAAAEQADRRQQAVDYLRQGLAAGLKKNALREAAETRFGLSRNDVYRLLLALEQGRDVLE